MGSFGSSGSLTSISKWWWPLFWKLSPAWVTPMLRRPKRHQNPPLMEAPFCGHTQERTDALAAGFPWAHAENDRQVVVTDTAMSWMNFMTRALSRRLYGESATRNPWVGY